MKKFKKHKVMLMSAATGEGVNAVLDEVVKILASTPVEMPVIEEKTAETRSSGNKKGFGMIMRSKRDFFILNVDKDENVECKTIKFSHGKENVLFQCENWKNVDRKA